jgi:hypothetical protein
VKSHPTPGGNSDVQTKKGEVLKVLSFKELVRNRKESKVKIADISARNAGDPIATS